MPLDRAERENLARITPLVGVAGCRTPTADAPYHIVGEKYLTALTDCAGALPLVIPALAERFDAAALLDRVDGLMFTGSPSNIEPALYGGPASAEGTLHDPHRDATTLPLIRAAIAAGVPLIAICRGNQELNVALGGTLHQRVHELPGRLDHREDLNDPLEVQYGPSHQAFLSPGGLFESLAQGASEITVNSLHWQAVDRLAPGLVVEATAPDGTIEGVRVVDAPAFAVGVQWHPEWRATTNEFSTALFAAFGAACRERALARAEKAAA